MLLGVKFDLTPDFRTKLSDTKAVWLEKLQSASLGSHAARTDILLLFSALAAVAMVLPAGLSFAQMNPHPFWIPVLLVSARHGSRAGLVAAAIASALAVLWIDPARVSVDDIYTYTSKVAVEPVFWIAAALVLGSMRDASAADVSELEVKAQKLLEDRRLIAGEYSELLKRQKQLEQRLSMSEPPPIGELIGRLAALREATRETMPQRLQEAAELALGRCLIELHQRDGSAFVTTTVACAGQGVREHARRPRFKRAVFRALSSGPSYLTSERLVDADVLKGAVAAIALGSPAEPVRAVLVCEKLDPAISGGASPQTVETALRLLGDAIEQALATSERQSAKSMSSRQHARAA